MNEPNLYRRNFLLHLQERPGYDRPVLRKEPAREQANRSQLDQLHNEYAVTRQLTNVAGVRPVLAQEGTESRPVLLLEYIEGHSLAELIRSASLDLAEKLRLAVNLARALGRIHEHQVMHKDVSSGNILVAASEAAGSQGGIYLIDFGLASTTGEERPSRLTPDDTLVGTLAYVSPEQTGRMNRQVDYRSDLYSLGVCLFELFTGRRPFGSGDALEMIHAHIARRPEPPHQVDAGIPGPVSGIILKLLAKHAEDRYQTAEGLAADLQRCLEQWQRQGRMEPFELGAEDCTGRLQFPQRLYGREAEIGQLKTTLDHAIAGPAQLLLVAGYSGVGKTSLIHEIQKDAIAMQATFVEGKFDQLQRVLPYSAWEQALTQLVNNWLAGSEEALGRRRETILDAVGNSGQILIDVIPALERTIGPQPELPQLDGIENKNRFNYIFSRFISILATPEHPLVVFLDDLQWVDPASLDLIETLFTAQSTSSLLVIGAYRSNEVGSDHPLLASLESMRAENDRVAVMTLGGLASDHTDHFLADSLHLAVADCRDLSRALVDKTAGNPFYFRQLLHVMESEGVLRFTRERNRWVWEEGLQKSLPASGNVADLMVRRIRKLPIRTQHTMSMASCLGDRFDLATMSTITGQPQSDILAALNPAMQRGLIVRSSRHYRFVHDGIREAGYALIAESDLPRTRLDIGRSLVANTRAEDLDEQVFAVVSHLNAGRALIDSEAEKASVAALNLKAGQKAKAAAAFVDAKRYSEIGLELLGPDSWQGHYALTLALHNENGQLAALTGQYDQITPIASLIHDRAENALDRLRIDMTRIEAATMQYKLEEALEIGLRALRDLGIEMHSRPDPEDYRHLNDELVALLNNRSVDGVVELPEMSDEYALAASSLLASQMSTCFIVNPQLFPIINYRGAILALQYGRDTWSPFFCGVLALLPFGSIDRATSSDEAEEKIRLGRQLQELAGEMLEKPVAARGRIKGLQALTHAAPWIRPIEDGIKLAQATFRSGYETGDLLYGSYGAFHFAMQGFAAGMKLDRYQAKLSNYRESLHRIDQKTAPQWLSIHLQATENFQTLSPKPGKLSGTQLDEEEWYPAARVAKDTTGLHVFAVFKLVLAYHFDIDDQIREYAADLEHLLAGGLCLGTVVLLLFYYPLAKLRLLAGGDEKNPTETMNSVDDGLHVMELWSRSVPSTFRHKVDLIAAERARVSGDTDGALSHYERAIQGARESGFTHEEALANELYARFWAARGNDRFARQFMREAQSLYRKWGAHGKVEHLVKRHPDWLIGRSIVVDLSGTQVISGAKTGDLDLRTILKASQQIAGELGLDRLLAKLMANVIENSGARQGYLILREDGHWTIVAESSADDPQPYARVAKRIDETDALAKGIVRYVARTQQTVALEDALESGEFVNDPYVQAHRARSILCTPLVNKAKTTAILYLDNNLAPGVFSPERIGLLRLLSSQMAISIDNARIHAELEKLLASRSKALASAEAQVRTLFEHSPLGIALTSYEGRILTANRAVLEMLRITKEELFRRGVSDFYEQPDDRGVLLKKLEESGFVQDFGVRLLRHDGARFYASVNMSKLDLEGNEVLLAMVEDVTAQITAEQESAVLEERARMARELHDAVSQTILSASLLADATARTWEQGRAIATEDLTNLSHMLRGALDELRTLLFELRPEALRDRTLGQMLGALAETARARSAAAVNLEIKGDHVLPERVAMTLHRIAQESLNNAIKHAQATMIDVDLACDPDQVVVRIVDDGLGFEHERSPSGHYGLDNMRERAEEIGAVLGIESRVGGGTRVTVTWS